MTNGAAASSSSPHADDAASSQGADHQELPMMCGPSCGSDHAQAGSVTRNNALLHQATATLKVSVPVGSISRK
jgi:hypothetical protein